MMVQSRGEEKRKKCAEGVVIEERAVCDKNCDQQQMGGDLLNRDAGNGGRVWRLIGCCRIIHVPIRTKRPVRGDTPGHRRVGTLEARYPTSGIYSLTAALPGRDDQSPSLCSFSRNAQIRGTNCDKDEHAATGEEYVIGVIPGHVRRGRLCQVQPRVGRLRLRLW